MSVSIYILIVLEARELVVEARPKLSNCTFTDSSGHSDQNGLERQALTGEMLRLDPLLTLREAVRPVPGLNKHLTDSSPPPRTTQGINFLTLSRVLSRYIRLY